ncbi:MAG: hypothetical protein COB24_07555 [Hyphomicrobiales bacterium]|nr:MAG: hypothetical protein COB24_07555 [Hyphomicrobiales bacterium]
MDKIQRHVDVYIYDNVNALDVSGISEAFHTAVVNGQRAYKMRYVSLTGENVTSSCGLKLVADIALHEITDADDLLLPGGLGVNHQLQQKDLIEHIHNWQIGKPQRRLISICSGALLLAEAGVLNERLATTHWGRRDYVLKNYRKVNWQVDRIYVADGNIYSSAGVTAGVDLALAIIKQDCGAEIALDVARELVVSIHRSGGQTQYSDILRSQYLVQNSLGNLLDQLVASPQKNWTLEIMAAEVSMTSRTLSRKFNDQLKMSPMSYVEKIRVKHAENLLGLGVSTQRAAQQSGFGSLQRMRRGFERQIGITPAAYVEKFCQIYS